MISSIGPDLELENVIGAAVESRKTWRAMAMFAEKVMQEKERRERER